MIQKYVMKLKFYIFYFGGDTNDPLLAIALAHEQGVTRL